MGVGLVVFSLGFFVYSKMRIEHVPSSVQQPVLPNVGMRPHSFAECVTQGYTVQETQPRRCQAGKVAFLEVASMPDQHTLAVPVQLDNITPNTLVISPLAVNGTAPGNWFFEGNIGLRVLDDEGAEVARGNAQANGDWMTDQQVRFGGTIPFTIPTSERGYIEIQKDNPSDRLELDASIRIPIRFK